MKYLEICGIICTFAGRFKINYKTLQTTKYKTNGKDTLPLISRSTIY